MLIFSSILDINKSNVFPNKEIPVCLADMKVIGKCLLRIKEKLVVGHFQVDEEILDGIDFYYQILPLESKKIKRIMINLIPSQASLVLNAEPELTN